MELYDLIIIGTGPAGLTASIYASCFNLKHLVIGTVLGGQMINAPDILNYPGFEEISGKELTGKMVDQVRKRGGEIVIQSVTIISNIKNQISQPKADPLLEERTQIKDQIEENYSDYKFEVESQEGNKYQTKSIILATGTERRKLNIPGEVEYTGRGIHYCATCARVEYEGKICAVVGGGNSAVQGAVQLSQSAKKVYIIYRGTELRGDPIWLEQIKKSNKIEVIYSTIATEIIGDGSKVTAVTLNSKFKIQNSKLQLKTQNEGNNIYSLPIDKIFIEIGGVPGTALVIPLGVVTDEKGYIKVDDKLETNIPGIFAAGDLVSSGMSIEQISTAIGLGARAAASAFAYLKSEKAPILWGVSQIKR